MVPIDANGKIWLPGPMRVLPCTTTWASRCTPSCNSTSAPTTQYGPIGNRVGDPRAVIDHSGRMNISHQGSLIMAEIVASATSFAVHMGLRP